MSDGPRSTAEAAPPARGPATAPARAPSVAGAVVAGAATALLIATLGLVLVVVVGFEGSRATAVGVSAATLAMVIGGLALGLWTARRTAPVRGPDLEVTGTPWLAVGAAAVVLGALAGGAWALEVAAHVGTFARGSILTGVLVVPAFVLIGLGASLGARAEKRWSLGAVAGIVVLLGLQIGGAALAPLLSWDGDVIAATIGSTTLVSFLVAGLIISKVTGRLGFVEIWLTALTYGYAIFLLVGRFGEPLLSRANIPEQQVLVSLSIAPTAIAVALLSVGASIGFLLWGGARADARFGVEVMLALRYLKLKPRSWMLLIAVVPIASKATNGLFVVVPLVVALSLLSVAIVVGLVVLLWLLVYERKTQPSVGRPRRLGVVGATLFFSVAGVSLGVTALIVVLSVMGGFEEDIKSKILGAHAHVAITKKGDDFSEYAETAAKLARVDGVRTAVAFVLAEGMISSDAGLSGTLVKGVDPLDPGAVGDLEKATESGHIQDLLHPERIKGASTRRLRLEADGGAETSSAAGPRDFAAPIVSGDAGPSTRVAPGIVIGREMARTLRVRVGDTVNLVSPASEELGPNGPAPKLRRFRVAAIFFSGMYEFDSKFSYVDIKQAQRFFGLSGRATGVELRVSDLSATARIVEEVKRRVGGHPFSVRDWREMNKELFSALLLEKIAMFIVLTFIILVASFLIVSTLVMIVLEKTHEIAILKSIGASDASVMKVFVIQGLIIGFGGAALGLLMGWSICLAVQHYGVGLDPDIFYITELPVVINWNEIAAVVSSALVITYLASIYPAMAAAAMRPVEGLRDD